MEEGLPRGQAGGDEVAIFKRLGCEYGSPEVHPGSKAAPGARERRDGGGSGARFAEMYDLLIGLIFLAMVLAPAIVASLHQSGADGDT